MNDDIKNNVKLTHKLCDHYLRHKRNNKDFVKLEDFRNEIDNLISKSEIEFYQNINRKLNNLSTSSRTYWSIMKAFFNGKKVPAIRPFLFNGAFVFDFQEKANIFNSFFAKQGTLGSNNMESGFTLLKNGDRHNT